MKTLNLSTISTEWISIIEKIPQKIKDDVDAAVLRDEAKYGESLLILPSKDLRLASLTYFKPAETKIVIIGQDPYIQPEQPMGLSFSVPLGISIPPSLKNIYKELVSDIDGFQAPNHGDLTKWAKQGMLLLNASLIVVERLSNSHKKVWQEFIPKFLEIFSNENYQVIYLLSGTDAKVMKKYIKSGIFIEGAHPSPLARGAFFGGKYFSRANAELVKIGKTPIDWGCL